MQHHTFTITGPNFYVQTYKQIKLQSLPYVDFLMLTTKIHFISTGLSANYTHFCCKTSQYHRSILFGHSLEFSSFKNERLIICSNILSVLGKFAVGKLASGNFAAVKFCTPSIYAPPCTLPSTVHCPVHLHTNPAPSVYTALCLLGKIS